jgi:hypothetical protein
LFPITGVLNHFDVTQIDITFDMLPGFDTVYFDLVFGSDEWPEYAGTNFIDAFGLYVNGTNVATAGGFPINVDHPNFASIVETELDGVLAFPPTPRLSIAEFVGNASTGNSLTFIIADSGDAALDSTAYLTSLGGTPPSIAPEPSSLAVFGTIFLTGSLFEWLRRRRSRFHGGGWRERART